MKLYTKLTAAVLMLATAAFALTSCGGDDDDEPEQPKNWSTVYAYSFKLSADVLRTAEVTAHIARPDGTFSTEAVTTLNPSWTLKGTNVPDKAGILLTFVPKKDIDTGATYKIDIFGSVTAESLYGEGVIGYKNYSHGTTMTISGAKLAEYFTGRGVAFAYGTDAQGEMSALPVDSFDFGLNGFWKWLSGFFEEE